jgi:hypothetical protein
MCERVVGYATNADGIGEGLKQNETNVAVHRCSIGRRSLGGPECDKADTGFISKAERDHDTRIR